MTPFYFGRLVKIAFELPTQPKPPTPTPAPPPPPQNKPPQQRTWSNFLTGTHQPSNPTLYDDYRRTMSRYISPWNQDTSGAEGTDRGMTDTALKWGTRAALGTGAVAGTAAAGLAAAPAVAGIGSGVGTTASAAGGGGAAATQTPVGQNFMQNASNAVGSAGAWMANQVPRAQQFMANQAFRGNQLAHNAKDLEHKIMHRMPKPIQAWHEGVESAPGANLATLKLRADNPGDIKSWLPHSVTLPYEAAHSAAHAFGGHGADHAPGGHGPMHAGMH